MAPQEGEQAESPPHDYEYNKKTGEIKLVKLTNDKFDRIITKKQKVFYNEKGNAKRVLLDKIPKGILKDHQNFKKRNITINFDGKDQPTLEEIKTHFVKFSEYITKSETSGYITEDIRNGQKSVYLQINKGNTYTKSYNTSRKYNEYTSKYRRVKRHWRTHPGEGENAEIASKGDEKLYMKNTTKGSYPHEIWTNTSTILYTDKSKK